MKIRNLLIAIVVLLLYGCATVQDYNVEPEHEPDFESRIMLYRFEF